MKIETKNKAAIGLGILGLVTSFYIFPVILNVAGIVLSVQVLKTTKKRQGRAALAINIAGILAAIGLMIFLSRLNFTSEEFGF